MSKMMSRAPMRPKNLQGPLRQQGLTLIEIMIVVVILGMLALAIIPNITGRADQASVARAKSDIQALSSQLELFKTDNFRYPTTDEGLEALVTPPNNVKNYPKNGYIKRLNQDPWGNDYLYFSPVEGADFEILSLGADGVEGGEDFAADISSLE